MINILSNDIFNLEKNPLQGHSEFVFFNKLSLNKIPRHDLNNNVSACIKGNMIYFKSLIFYRVGGVLKASDNGVHFSPIKITARESHSIDNSIIDIIDENEIFSEKSLKIICEYDNIHKESLCMYQKKHLISPKKTTHSVDDLSSFIKITNELSSEDSEYSYFFRGHSKDDFRIAPSLFRDGYFNHEKSICNDIINVCCDDFEKDKSALDKLVRMQHFGLPTRLLDITTNPLVALYFSLKENPESDGDVIIFKLKKDKIKHHESDTVSCISNMYNLSELEKSEIRRSYLSNKINFSSEKERSIQEFNRHNESKRLVQFIKTEKPYFLNEINPSDLFDCFFVVGKLSNPRIRAQSGCFIIFGDNASFDDEEIKTEHIIINKENKNSILNELSKIGINKYSIFPDISSAAEIIKENYKITKD